MLTFKQATVLTGGLEKGRKGGREAQVGQYNCPGKAMAPDCGRTRNTRQIDGLLSMSGCQAGD